jgi:ElaB/YqjD/DUF883 family membrane-anchored ribosome-binding protein
MGIEEKLSHRADEALSATQDQISRLREQVDRLVKDLKPAVSQMANRTGAVLSDATDAASAQARQMMRDVTPMQIGLVVLAAGIGWMLGRSSR